MAKLYKVEIYFTDSNDEYRDLDHFKENA